MIRDVACPDERGYSPDLGRVRRSSMKTLDNQTDDRDAELTVKPKTAKLNTDELSPTVSQSCFVMIFFIANRVIDRTSL